MTPRPAALTQTAKIKVGNCRQVHPGPPGGSVHLQEVGHQRLGQAQREQVLPGSKLYFRCVIISIRDLFPHLLAPFTLTSHMHHWSASAGLFHDYRPALYQCCGMTIAGVIHTANKQDVQYYLSNQILKVYVSSTQGRLQRVVFSGGAIEPPPSYTLLSAGR